MIASRYAKAVARLRTEIASFQRVDYEDHDTLEVMRGQYNKVNKAEKDYQRYRVSPERRFSPAEVFFARKGYNFDILNEIND